MFHKLFTILSLLSLSLHQVQAQSSSISVGPLLNCDLTTFQCPGTSGCCNIGGCCGSGCCALGYRCINEGTSSQACCNVNDLTKCGTVSTPSPAPGTGTGTGGNTCTQIHNCRDFNGKTWTCLLGQTCQLYYRGCNPCPYIGGGGGSSGSSSSSAASGGSATTSSQAGTSSTSSSSASTSSSAASGHRLGEAWSILHWLAAVGLGGVFAGAV
ncbi:hypothetical protein B0H63DRAFT_124333 [Podospora didyma]|uniref:GPI anchored protein n=1 Tax=Podospora didyma TaxID=330526 RepID=A0AAE0P006_9PEZI|nr:hypothetical protein B0H63DRAFT_124333 [Podospora didyma]